MPQPPVSAPRAPAPRPMNPGAQQLVYTLDGWIKIVSSRMLSLLGVLGGIGIFGYAIYDPQQVRAWTAAAYAVTVLWPTIYLYLRRD